MKLQFSNSALQENVEKRNTILNTDFPFINYNFQDSKLQFQTCKLNIFQGMTS